MPTGRRSSNAYTGPASFDLHQDGRLAGRGHVTAEGDLLLDRGTGDADAVVRLPRALLETCREPATAGVQVAEN